jgi:nitroimidazol reductase NimA-like FMN-containing flavoprotein (pyridoxamine 5'-phosphate oxidase superfamily)
MYYHFQFMSEVRRFLADNPKAKLTAWQHRTDQPNWYSVFVPKNA